MTTDVKRFCLTPGTILGKHFQIIKLIGQGGMGTVYMAYDTRLDLRVAIKVISPEFSCTLEDSGLEGLLKRFESEAKIAAKIDHANVIRIFGFNHEKLDVDGRQYDIDYLVMELLSGRTLRNTMDVSGFETDEEIRAWIGKYLFPVLDGLQKVHESDIIHRDIKPENFFLKDDVPNLADFGLSLGFDLPSVTGSVADIFGTMHYMSPEQFFNFSLARETADIYAIGKILFEAVEGKLTDTVKPLKQARLSNPESDFRTSLNRIVMDATAEDPKQRIGSVEELKNRLSQLLYCPGSQVSAAPRFSKLKPPVLMNKIFLILLAVMAIAAGAMAVHWIFDKRLPPPAAKTSTVPVEQVTDRVRQVKYLPYPDYPRQISQTGNHSILRLIPPAELQMRDRDLFPAETLTIKGFYLSETPVTNQQYVDFLNSLIDRARVKESDVYLDDRLVLKLSEKIRGYKTIVLENGGFVVKDPMHSACAVLMVTGFGAEAYARHYGMRLPSSREWFFVMQTGNGLRDTRRKPLPMPVINYEEDKYGLLCEQHPTKLIHEKEDDMKRTLLKNLPALTAVCLAFSLIWVQIGGAVQKHQQPGNEKSKPAAGESSSLGMMPGSGGEPEMMGMMGGPGDEGGQDMMGPGMMRMMMSHMMGGPGGMGKMMGKMGRGMKGRGGMAHMARMLEELNLTPEQWDQVRTLARERLEKMADLWAQRMKLQIELAALRWDTEIDPQKVKDLFVKKAEAKAEMFLAGLAYMRELKKIITAEQLKKLESQGF